MPLYTEGFGDSLAAKFGGRGKVIFDVKEENLPSSNKIEAAHMYDMKGKILGKITYAILPDKKVEIQGFAIDDWNPKAHNGQRILKWFVGQMRKRGINEIVGGIFSTDTRTSDKLDMFRAEGFSIKEVGSMAGHNEYHVELLL
jgi:N-acetylglutamate synthase-like GNAT family acetyltransferase